MLRVILLFPPVVFPNPQPLWFQQSEMEQRREDRWPGAEGRSEQSWGMRQRGGLSAGKATGLC